MQTQINGPHLPAQGSLSASGWRLVPGLRDAGTGAVPALRPACQQPGARRGLARRGAAGSCPPSGPAKAPRVAASALLGLITCCAHVPHLSFLGRVCTVQEENHTPSVLGELASPETHLHPSRPRAVSPRHERLVRGREESPRGADRTCDLQTQCRFYDCVIIVLLLLRTRWIRNCAELRSGMTFTQSGWKVSAVDGEPTRDGWSYRGGSPRGVSAGLEGGPLWARGARVACR